MDAVFQVMVAPVSLGVDATDEITGPASDCVMKLFSLDVAIFPPASRDCAMK
jgi:hypothetical protein